jgi:hypothetical protein
MQEVSAALRAFVAPFFTPKRVLGRDLDVISSVGIDPVCVSLGPFVRWSHPGRSSARASQVPSNGQALLLVVAGYDAGRITSSDPDQDTASH